MYSITISPYLGDLPDPQQQRGPRPPGLHRHPLLQAHQDPQLWNGENHNTCAALGVILKTNDSLLTWLEATLFTFMLKIRLLYSISGQIALPGSLV